MNQTAEDERIHANRSPVVDKVASNSQKLVNKREIAHRYGVSERTIQEWMEKAMIPFYKPGYMVRFDPEECDIALNRFKVPSGGNFQREPGRHHPSGSELASASVS
jgi:excisionase family DNA binding protein